MEEREGVKEREKGSHSNFLQQVKMLHFLVIIHQVVYWDVLKSLIVLIKMNTLKRY